jgi:BASS family bile acid:Na+ symporter
MNAQALVPLIVEISLILIVAAVGLRSRWRDLTYDIRRPRWLFRGILAVNVVVPLTAVVMILILPIAPPVKAGILLMAISPMAPFVPARMLKAGAGRGLAFGEYFALILLAILIVPGTLHLMSAFGPREVSLPIGTITWFIFVSVLLPLGGGLLVAELLPRHAALLSRIASTTGNLLLVPVALIILFKLSGTLLGLIGDGTLLAMIVTTVAGLAAGHFLGGREPVNQIALSMAATTRHPGIAAIIADRHFDDERVMPAVILFLLVGAVVSTLYMVWAEKRLPPAPVILPNRGPGPSPDLPRGG